MKKFIRLKELSTVVGAAMLCMLGIVSDLDAVVYGKLNGGNSIGYKETLERANRGDGEARDKIDEAQRFAGIINRISPQAFNIIPTGMSREEFMFEALNYTRNTTGADQAYRQIDAKTRAGLTDDEKRNLERWNGYSDANIKQASNKVVPIVKKLQEISKQLSVGKNSTDKAIKKTVQAILERLSDAKGSVTQLLRRAVGHMADIQQNGGRDSRVRFKEKVNFIGEVAQNLRTQINDFQFDFDEIYREKRDEVYRADVDFLANNGLGRNRAPLVKVNMREVNPRTKEVMEGYKEQVQLLIDSMQVFVHSLFTEMLRMDKVHDIEDDDLKRVVQSLSSFLDYSVISDEGSIGSLNYFAGCGLFALAVTRDIEFQRELFELIDNNHRLDKAPAGTDPNLNSRMLVPPPDDGSWYKCALEYNWTQLPRELKMAVSRLEGFRTADGNVIPAGTDADTIESIDMTWVNEQWDRILPVIESYVSGNAHADVVRYRLPGR